MMVKKLAAWWKAGAVTLVVVATGLAVAGGLGVLGCLDVPVAESARPHSDPVDSATIALRVEGMT